MSSATVTTLSASASLALHQPFGNDTLIFSVGFGGIVFPKIDVPTVNSHACEVAGLEVGVLWNAYRRTRHDRSFPVKGYGTLFSPRFELLCRGLAGNLSLGSSKTYKKWRGPDLTLSVDLVDGRFTAKCCRGGWPVADRQNN